LDDTLLDYSGGADRSWAEACASCCPPSGIDPAMLVATLAETRRWFWDDPVRQRTERLNMVGAWQHIVEFALERLGRSAPSLAAAIARDYAVRRRGAMSLFREALGCLAELRRCGVPMAMVTNGDATQQRDKIDRHRLASYFDAILIEGEFGAGKPEAAVYRHALQALGAAPTDAWMVGAHLEWDVGAPQQLGLRGGGVDRGGRGVPPSSGVQLPGIIRSLHERAALAR